MRTVLYHFCTLQMLIHVVTQFQDCPKQVTDVLYLHIDVNVTVYARARVTTNLQIQYENRCDLSRFLEVSKHVVRMQHTTYCRL